MMTINNDETFPEQKKSTDFKDLTSKYTAKHKEEERISRFNQWIPLLDAVGLPTDRKQLDETSQAKFFQMPIADFRKLVKIKGKVPGYWDHDIKVCLAGGSILSWVTGNEIKDHDYFPENIAEAEKFSNYLLKDRRYSYLSYQGLKKQADDIFGIEDWTPDPKDLGWYSKLSGNLDKYLPDRTIDPLVTRNEEVIRALNYIKDGTTTMRQIVLVIRGSSSEVINTFDFSVTQWAIDKENIYWGKYTIQDMVRNRVRINRIHHPLSTIRRMVKYSQKGYFFCNGTMIDIADALSEYTRARIDAGLSPLDEQIISLD